MKKKIAERIKDKYRKFRNGAKRERNGISRRKQALHEEDSRIFIKFLCAQNTESRKYDFTVSGHVT